MARNPSVNQPFVNPQNGFITDAWLRYLMSLGASSDGLSVLSNTLVADVTLTTQNVFYDGPMIAQGTAGTWFVSGSVVVRDTAGQATFRAYMHDGTTVMASAQIVVAAGFQGQIALSGYISNPAGNLRISVADTTSTTSTGKIKFNASTKSADSTITAFRIG